MTHKIKPKSEGIKQPIRVGAFDVAQSMGISYTVEPLNDQGAGMPENDKVGTDNLPLTIRGKLKLEEELKRLITKERPSIIKAIEEARAHGDISENAEYEAAKERQGMVEGRILEVQGQLAGAQIVDTALIKSNRIVFGAHVVLLDTETEEKVSYQIVGTDEADVKLGKISVMSPLARSLIGKVKGDVVQVRSPKTEKEFEVISFEFK